jgi:hypothetical protein
MHAWNVMYDEDWNVIWKQCQVCSKNVDYVLDEERDNGEESKSEPIGDGPNRPNWPYEGLEYGWGHGDLGSIPR